MSELLTTVMAGARQVMRAQAVNANNLANASTDGFRAELVHVTGLQDVDGLRSTPDLKQGMVRTTGNSLDVSVAGEGWIAILTPEGTEGYTRRGDLQVDALGQLTNGNGQAIMGERGPISLPPFSNVEIAADGSISIQPLGDPASSRAVVDRIKLVNPDQRDLRRGADGILRLPPGATMEADANVKVQGGTLEGSNVNAVGEMLRMMDLARQFEAQVQLMKTAEEDSASLASVLRLS
jgi:flagellar basal-body rod protein FlgF